MVRNQVNIRYAFLVILLYFSIGLPDPPVEGLFSGCAVGIIHSDLQVSELVLKELVRHQNDSRYIHHIAFLTAQFHQNNVNAI